MLAQFRESWVLKSLRFLDGAGWHFFDRLRVVECIANLFANHQPRRRDGEQGSSNSCKDANELHSEAVEEIVLGGLCAGTRTQVLSILAICTASL
jgi:hypothetical protein